MKSSDSVFQNKYSDFSDEELILKYRDGEKDIEDYILNKYKNLVLSKAKSMYIIGGDTDDCIQEGMIGLFKAIRDYDFGRDAGFFTFADLCISRQMYTAVTASGRKKHMPLNSYISLYADEEDDFNTSLMETLSDERENNPENMLIDKENVDEIEKIIESELSDFEKSVIELYLTGMGYVQIAKVLCKDEKSTDNALSRARSKIKKYIKAQ